MFLLVAACTTAPGTHASDTPTDPTDPHSEPTGDTAEPPGPAPALPLLVVDELMSSNRSTVNASDGSMADWVELLNADTGPIALARVQLRDQAHHVWTGTADDGVIEPGERRIVWLGSGGGGGTWTGFALDQDGDELVVVVDGRLLEVIEVPPLDDDVAFARTPDATGELAPTAWPTPGAPNGDEVSSTLDPADATWFVTGKVHQIDFTFPQATVAELDDPTRPEVHAAMSVDGVNYDDVGLKLKGSASYQPMSGKPSFIVDLNEWVPGTRLRGLQGFKLHNGMGGDTTRVKEHLTYGLARELGLMAPRVGWAVVSCNGQDFGVYVIVENHDDRFVAYHHPTQGETGVVLEPNETTGQSWGDFGNGSLPDWNREEGPSPPDPLTVAALSRIDEVVTRSPTDENVAVLFEDLDEASLHTYMAWESVIMHSDGYMVANNWRVFVDGDTHRVSLLPSGADLTWRLDVQAWWFFGKVADFCLQNQGCRRAYAARMVEVADLTDSLALDDEFVRQSTFLDPWIQSDPRFPVALRYVTMEREITLERLRLNPQQARDAAYDEFPELRP